MLRPAHVILASNQLGGAVVVCATIIIVLALIGAVLDRKAQARYAFTRQLAEQTVLLGKKHLPEERPPYYSPGQENEAIIYARMFLPGWRNSPPVQTTAPKNIPCVGTCAPSAYC